MATSTSPAKSDPAEEAVPERLIDRTRTFDGNTESGQSSGLHVYCFDKECE